MLYMNKKLRGLGYSELRKQRAAIPQSWHIVAKDLFRHSAKKREDETNILPHLRSADCKRFAVISHLPNASALPRTGSYPAPGCKGRRKPLAKNKT